jgi:hypothetical protein
MPPSLLERGVTEAQFYNNLAAYRNELAGVRVDTAAFIAELEERVVTPLREAQAMIDRQPYLTRLYATVSPIEMKDRDPLFHFNPGLPTVSNQHTAKAVGGTCQADGSIVDLVLQLENGERIQYGRVFPSRPLGPSPGPAPAGSGPAAARIELIGTSGAPTSYTAAEAKTIDQDLNHTPPEVVLSRPKPGTAGFWSCSTGGPARAFTAAGLLALLALGLAAGRRRG